MPGTHRLPLVTTVAAAPPEAIFKGVALGLPPLSRYLDSPTDWQLTTNNDENRHAQKSRRCLNKGILRRGRAATAGPIPDSVSKRRADMGCNTWRLAKFLSWRAKKARHLPRARTSA